MSKKKTFFLSLNYKLLLVAMTTFLLASGISLFVFISAFVSQMEAEALFNKNKAEIIWDMYQENRELRNVFRKIYEKKEFYDELLQSQKERLDALLTKDRFFSIRYNLFSDKQNLKEREQKIQMISVYITLSVLLFMLMLIFLWIYIRRWVMEPLEQLLKGTQKLSEGQWDYRLQEKPVKMTDEMQLLEKNFNAMARSLENKVMALKKNEEFLQNLLDAIPDGVRVIDEDFNMVRMNKTYAEQYASLSGNLLSDKCYYSRCHADKPCPEENCPLVRLKQEDGSSIKIIQPFYKKGNQEIFTEVVAAPLFVEQEAKKIRYTIEIIRSLEQEIMFSHQQKLSSLGVLASSVAHEMRNPLGSMRLILENILDRLPDKPLSDEEMKKYLTLIYNQITACIDVTTRLLKLARKPTEKKEKVDLNEVVFETASLMEYEAKKEGININISLLDKKAEILATDAEMRIMVLNFMQNAIRAMKNSGEIVLKVSEKDNQYLLECKDNGCGISENDLPHVFEPFYSKRKKDSAEKKGTGLGLAIVKNIVESHGGTIYINSTINQGTTITVAFPFYIEGQEALS